MLVGPGRLLPDVQLFWHPLPNFRNREATNDFPDVASARGTCFVFIIFFYDVPCGRNTVG
jgi:hypothetical protein